MLNPREILIMFCWNQFFDNKCRCREKNMLVSNKERHHKMPLFNGYTCIPPRLIACPVPGPAGAYTESFQGGLGVFLVLFSYIYNEKLCEVTKFPKFVNPPKPPLCTPLPWSSLTFVESVGPDQPSLQIPPEFQQRTTAGSLSSCLPHLDTFCVKHTCS